MSTASRIPVHANRLDPAVEELCREGLTCQLAGSLTELWFVIAVGLALGAGIASVGYLRSARSALKEEQSRTAAEQAAFEAFARRVAGLRTANVQTPNQTTDGAISVVGSSSPSASPLDNVRKAYQETVMDLAHYDEEYGEPLEKNLAFEFGRDIATTVFDGDQFTPQLQKAIISAAKKAARERARLRGALGREDESLREFGESFSDVQCALNEYQPRKLRSESYQSLLEGWEELDTLEKQCSNALDARQQRLMSEPMGKGGSADKPSLFEYLYQSLEVNYPVLATGTNLIVQIQKSRLTLTRVASSQP